jgi:hypothetical protein
MPCAKTRRGAPSAGTERVAADAMGSGTMPMRRPRHVLFTMSNSAVFFVPAARCCARVFIFIFFFAS